LGQCRLRHELNEMARYPQREHASSWPPKAEVRQARMALKIFRCSQVNHFRLRSKNESGAARRISATSTGGRAIYWGSARFALRVNRASVSSGLAVALRCRCDRWR